MVYQQHFLMLTSYILKTGRHCLLIVIIDQVVIRKVKKFPITTLWWGLFFRQLDCRKRHKGEGETEGGGGGAGKVFRWQAHIAPRKGIQDSLGFWIPHCGFRIPGTGFWYLSVELGFWIPVVSGIQIPWAVFQIPKPGIPDSMSKIFPDSRFHKCKFPGFQNLDSLTLGET